MTGKEYIQTPWILAKYQACQIKLLKYSPQGCFNLVHVFSLSLCVCVRVCDVLSPCFPKDECQNCPTRHCYNCSFITRTCLCLLPPRPKLLAPFGLPKPPLAGRLVEGQESASQGRPGSPAFSRPGRL